MYVHVVVEPYVAKGLQQRSQCLKLWTARILSICLDGLNVAWKQASHSETCWQPVVELERDASLSENHGYCATLQVLVEKRGDLQPNSKVPRSTKAKGCCVLYATVL